MIHTSNNLSCNLCDLKIPGTEGSVIFDAAVPHLNGRWAWLCPECWAEKVYHAPPYPDTGLGTGVAQQFTCTNSGPGTTSVWKKTGG